MFEESMIIVGRSFTLMMKIILLVFFLTLSALAFSQGQKTIQSDRPGQANSPFSVGSGNFQLQTGLDYERGENVSINFKSTSYYGNTFLRYGITDKIDFTTSWTYSHERSNLNEKADQIAEVGVGSFGTRIAIFEGKGSIPAVGMQVSLKLPAFNSTFKQYLAPNFQLIASNKLFGQLSYTANLGVDYNGITPIPIGFYVFNLGYSLSQKVSIFAENYGNSSNSDFNTFWDFGFAFLQSNNLQWDLFAGFSENDGLEMYFISMGVSWRLLKKTNQTQ